MCGNVDIIRSFEYFLINNIIILIFVNVLFPVAIQLMVFDDLDVIIL